MALLACSPFCPSSQKSGCHYGGCSPPPDITPIIPTQLAASINTSPPHRPGLLVSGVYPHHRGDPYKSRKTGENAVRSRKVFNRSSPGKGLSNNRLKGECRQCQWAGATGRWQGNHSPDHTQRASKFTARRVPGSVGKPSGLLPHQAPRDKRRPTPSSERGPSGSQGSLSPSSTPVAAIPDPSARAKEKVL